MTEKTDRNARRAEIAAPDWTLLWGDLINEWDIAKLFGSIPTGTIGAWVSNQIEDQLKKFQQSLNDVSDELVNLASDYLKDLVKNHRSGEREFEGLGVKAGVATYRRHLKTDVGKIPLPNNHQPYIGLRVTKPLPATLPSVTPAKFPDWQLLDNNSATISIIEDDNNLYQLHNTGRIWKYTGVPMTGWQPLDNNASTVQIVATGTELYQLHATGRIWKYTRVPMTGWQLLDDNPSTREIVASGGDLYQLHTTGRIWKYTGVPMTGWQPLDDNSATKKIAAGVSGLYQIHKTGAIWKYVGPPMTGWKQLDANPASTQIVVGKSLHQLHDTGHIWRYTG